jgi:hypothetical protein
MYQYHVGTEMSETRKAHYGVAGAAVDMYNKQAMDCDWTGHSVNRTLHVWEQVAITHKKHVGPKAGVD